MANQNSNDVSAYTIDSTTGALTLVAGSNFPAGTNPRSLTVDRTNSFVYVANSGSNDVSAYSIDGTTGALTPLGSPFPTGDGTAFSVTIDPTNQFAYVVKTFSSNLVSYAIDPMTGALMQVTGSDFPGGSRPISVTTTSGPQPPTVLKRPGRGTASLRSGSSHSATVLLKATGLLISAIDR